MLILCGIFHLFLFQEFQIIKYPYRFVFLSSMDSIIGFLMFQLWQFKWSSKFTMLTPQEKIEILELSGSRSNRETAREFNNRYPNRPVPLHYRTVSKIKNHFREHGTIHRKKRTKSLQSQKDIAQRKAEVAEYFDEHPHESTRRASAILMMPHTFIWRALKDSKLKPYKMSVHQKLHEGDHIKREEFCTRLLNRFNQDPNFYKCILWSDEKSFKVTESFNRQNMR